jgi:hypothetical protein
MQHRFWVGLVFRIFAAAVGGYACAYAVAAALTMWLPLSKPDAVLIPAMLSSIVYVAAILWTFSARTPLRAWAGLFAVAAPCAVVAWLA